MRAIAIAPATPESATSNKHKRRLVNASSIGLEKPRKTVALILTCFLSLALFPSMLRADEAEKKEEQNEKQQLTIAASNNFPPINLLDEDGQLSGFARDLSGAVAEAIGAEARYIHSDAWLEVLSWLDDETADLIHDTGFTQERSAYLDFTDPIIEMPEVIFVRRDQLNIHDLASLDGKKVACVDQHITHLYLERFNEINCYLVNTPAEGLTALVNGDVDAFIYPQQIVFYLAHQLRFTGDIKAVGEPLRALNWSMTVKAGNQALLKQLNSGIKTVRESGEYQRIYERWFGTHLLSGYSRNEVIWILAVGILLSLFIALSISLLLYARGIKRASRKLIESESIYRTLADNLPYSVFLKDINSIYISCNQHHAKSLGIQAKDIVGKTDYDFHPKNAEIYRASDRVVVETEKPHEFSEKYIERGKEISIHTTKTPAFSAQNELNGVLGIIRDVSAIEQAQQKLLQKEHEQREILDSMVDAVFTFDETCKILTFNKTAEIQFGYTLDEVAGKKLNLLLPEPFSSQCKRDLHEYLESGETRMFGIAREMRGLCENEKTFPMRLSVAELAREPDGKRRFIGSCQNLTKIKQQEEQLSRAQKMEALGKLTGGIAHDYSNMLGVTLGYSEILESELADQPELLECAREIHHASERGAKLTKKLLDFSRKTPSEAKLLRLNKLLRNERNLLEKTLTARIKLKLDLGEDLWAAWLDENDLEDAILNTSINAMHAMDGNGTLTILTRNEKLDSLEAQQLGLRPGDYILLTISDTGCGMDEATREKIFEPFYSTKGEKGTGLGLSQVYGFVERSHGAIKVYSEVNIGTKLMLYFPRHAENDNSDKKGQNRLKEEDLNGHESILIVDDEKSLLKLASKILSKRGYTTFCANDHRQALDIMEKESIDLLFSDVIMPEVNGYQLAMMVKAKHSDVIILMTSGFTDDLHDDIHDHSQFNDLLPKPYSSTNLLTSIRKALDK